MVIARPVELNMQLCKLLGIDTNHVTGVRLNLRANHIPEVEVTRHIGQVHPEELTLRFSLWPAGGTVSLGSLDVLFERKRQEEVEGWDDAHDDKHADGSLAKAAGCYAFGGARHGFLVLWPWDWKWWKPKDRRSDLVRAAALLLAEIDRIDRAAAKAKSP